MADDVPALPTNAEDLKRHKALSAMESTSIVTDSAPPPSTAANPEALGEALGSITAAAAPPPKPTSTAVKVKAEDVNLVMEHFELNKTKATDALRRNAGDLMATLKNLVSV